MRFLAFMLWFSPVWVGLPFGLHLGGTLSFVPALLCVIVILLGYGARFLPIIKWTTLSNANAINSQLYIEIDPSTPYPKAVLAQELYECIYKINPIKLIYSKTGKGASSPDQWQIRRDSHYT